MSFYTLHCILLLTNYLVYPLEIESGTLIGPGWVLCAAHCFDRNINAAKFHVRVGEWHLNQQDGSEQGDWISSQQINEISQISANEEHHTYTTYTSESLETTAPFRHRHKQTNKQTHVLLFFMCDKAPL